MFAKIISLIVISFSAITGNNVSPEQGVIITTPNEVGQAITANYQGTDYILWEDCSVSVEENNTHKPVKTDYVYFADMPENNPVKEPLLNTADEFMTWCASENF